MTSSQLTIQWICLHFDNVILVGLRKSMIASGMNLLSQFIPVKLCANNIPLEVFEIVCAPEASLLVGSVNCSLSVSLWIGDWRSSISLARHAFARFVSILYWNFGACNQGRSCPTCPKLVYLVGHHCEIHVIDGLTDRDTRWCIVF